jgi:hypothetical protein
MCDTNEGVESVKFSLDQLKFLDIILGTVRVCLILLLSTGDFTSSIT